MSSSPFSSAHSLRFGGLLLFFCSCVLGCASLSTQQRGDEALKNGEHNRALDLYEESIKGGNRDPGIFYNAAQASLGNGDLAGAERYYSRSIRYGGGVKSMRALAQLYVQTSNFTRASQVLYELLKFESQQQSTYNNLGTSLMYAGNPFAAESYLLIAQQMDPADPIPYVNLGLLYDNHMKRPSLGAQFYRCYLSMSPGDADQRRQITMRLGEIEGDTEGALSTDEVTCGQVYAPKATPSPPLGTLQREFAVTPSERDPGEIVLAPDAPDREDGAQAIVQSSGGVAPKMSQGAGPVVISKADMEQAPPSARAQELYLAGDYEAASRILELRSPEEMGVQDAQLMARIQTALKQPQDAELWWRLSLKRAPSTVALAELFKLLEAQKRTSELARLCQAYSGSEALSPIAHRCPSTP